MKLRRRGFFATLAAMVSAPALATAEQPQPQPPAPKPPATHEGEMLRLAEARRGITTHADIPIPDRCADAFRVKEGTSDYLSIDTLNGSEQLSFGRPRVTSRCAHRPGSQVLEFSSDGGPFLPLTSGSSK